MTAIIELLKKPNLKYEITYINAHKYILIGDVKILIYKNTMTIYTHEQCCSLPITPNTIKYLENVLNYENVIR